MSMYNGSKTGWPSGIAAKFIKSLKIGDVVEYERKSPPGVRKFKIREIGTGSSGYHAKGEGSDMLTEYAFTANLYIYVKVNGKDI